MYTGVKIYTRTLLGLNTAVTPRRNECMCSRYFVSEKGMTDNFIDVQCSMIRVKGK